MIRVLVVPGTMRPTRQEVDAADLVVKVDPPSARVSVLRGDVSIRRFPAGWDTPNTDLTELALYRAAVKAGARALDDAVTRGGRSLGEWGCEEIAELVLAESTPEEARA